MMESNLGIEKDVIKGALSLLFIEAPEQPEKLNIRSSASQVIVAFHDSWPPDLFTEDSKTMPFGETQIDREKFPSLRRIGSDVAAKVNDAFMAQFVRILEESDQTLREEVEEADKNKQIIFTGHSSGGPIAIYATVWLLEKHKSEKKETPRVFCLTFGSPLTTDRTFCHAIRREGWSDYFVHFVMKLDIIPRILLAPRSSTGELLKEIASSSNPHPEPISKDMKLDIILRILLAPPSSTGELLKEIASSSNPHPEPISKDLIPSLTSFFVNVKKNASCVANHAACALMGSKDPLFDTMSRFIKLSPYRPCGKYVFCTETGVLVVVENPDAVLQLLFYSLQIKSETGLQETAVASLRACWTYKDALDESLAQPTVVCLENLQELPFSSDNDALKDLNLCTSARLCLRAAGELEKKKLDNQKKIEDKKGAIKKALHALETYRTARKGGYYDAFKSQKEEEDFKANVKRLELAAIWDEIIEMIRQEELPDRFETDDEWVELGTQFRRLLEPIDIANYYRHSRNYVSGPYMEKGRPSRYTYTQRWKEHAEQLPKGSCGESCLWAEMEEFNLAFANGQWNEQKAFELAEKLKKWHDKKEVKKDAFLKETAVVKWWRTLPDNHEAKSLIKDLIDS